MRQFLVGVLLCALLAGGCGQEISGSLLTDARNIDARIGFAEPNSIIESGVVVGWNRDTPDHVGKVGGYAFLGITPDAQVPLANLLPGIGQWFNLPETVPAQLKLGGEVAAINLADNPQAAGGPIVKSQVGPVEFDFVWRFVENSSVPAYDGPWFMFGLRAIRF